jgi:DNA-binding NarL/FixJ family response regulator
VVTNIQANVPSATLEAKQFRRAAERTPTCVVYSNHPLALCLMRDAVSSDQRLGTRVKLYSAGLKPANNGDLQILILDICSVQNWAECLLEWQGEGAETIGLVSSDPQKSNLELQLLLRGVAGIVTFTDNLADQLPKAIDAVARGQLWIRRQVLNAYVKKTNLTARKFSAFDQKLTARENQIIDLLGQALPNRVIAKRLAISERTAKFHVSNILHKLNLSNRKEVQALKPDDVVSWCRRG